MPLDDEVLRTRISEVRSAVSELRRLTSRSFVELNIDEKYSMRYNIIVLVESLVSLCVHIATEAYAKRPASYREAVRVVAERLGVRCVEDLESLVGLRNLLIHRYWTVEDERIHGEVEANFECVEKLLGRVEEVFLR